MTTEFPSSEPLVDQLLRAGDQETGVKCRPLVALVAARARKRHEWGEISHPLAESCRQAKKSLFIFVDNIKRLQRRRPSTIDTLAHQPAPMKDSRYCITFPLPPPIQKTCGLGNRSCRVVNMKHTFSHASLLSPRVSPELFCTTASYPEIPCTRPISKGFPGADLSGCIADRILLAYHSLMCRKLFLLPLIASVRFYASQKSQLKEFNNSTSPCTFLTIGPRSSNMWTLDRRVSNKTHLL